MNERSMSATWPAPYLQPEPHTGCIEHAVAYIARCFGHADVMAQAVHQWREERRITENMYPTYVLGHPVERFFRAREAGDEAEFKRFWLGLDARAWVEAHLARGEIALVIVERVPGHAHALALLATCGDDGALVMDPLYGHRVEPWAWLLGVGPGGEGCHFIDGWYRREIDPTLRRIL